MEGDRHMCVSGGESEKYEVRRIATTCLDPLQFLHAGLLLSLECLPLMFMLLIHQFYFHLEMFLILHIGLHGGGIMHSMYMYMYVHD